MLSLFPSDACRRSGAVQVVTELEDTPPFHTVLFRPRVRRRSHSTGRIGIVQAASPARFCHRQRRARGRGCCEQRSNRFGVDSDCERSGGSATGNSFSSSRASCLCSCLCCARAPLPIDIRLPQGRRSVATLGRQFRAQKETPLRWCRDSDFSEREWLDLTLCLNHVRVPSRHISHASHARTGRAVLVNYNCHYCLLFGVGRPHTRRTRASVASFHLLSITFSVYAYRDIWPLHTFTLVPADSWEGTLLSVKIDLLAVVGIVIPWITPHQYVSLDPNATRDSPFSTSRMPDTSLKRLLNGHHVCP